MVAFNKAYNKNLDISLNSPFSTQKESSTVGNTKTNAPSKLTSIYSDAQNITYDSETIDQTDNIQIKKDNIKKYIINKFKNLNSTLISEDKLMPIVSSIIDKEFNSSSVNFNDVNAIITKISTEINKILGSSKQIYVDSDNSLYILSDIIKITKDFEDNIEIGFIQASDDINAKSKLLGFLKIIIDGKPNYVKLNHSYLTMHIDDQAMLKEMIRLFAIQLKNTPKEIQKAIVREKIEYEFFPITEEGNKYISAFYTKFNNTCNIGLTTDEDKLKFMTRSIIHELGHAVDQLNGQVLASNLDSSYINFLEEYNRSPEKYIQNHNVTLFKCLNDSLSTLSFDNALLYVPGKVNNQEQKVDNLIKDYVPGEFNIQKWATFLDVEPDKNGEYDKITVLEGIKKYAQNIGFDTSNMDEIPQKVIDFLVLNRTKNSSFNAEYLDNIDLQSWGKLLGLNRYESNDKQLVARKMLAILKKYDIENLPRKVKSDEKANEVITEFKNVLKNIKESEYIKAQRKKINIDDQDLLKAYIKYVGSSSVFKEFDQNLMVRVLVPYLQENNGHNAEIINNVIEANPILQKAKDKAFAVYSEYNNLLDSQVEKNKKLSYPQDKIEIENIIDNPQTQFTELFILYKSIEGYNSNAYCFDSSKEFFAEYYAYDNYARDDVDQTGSDEYFSKMENLNKKENKTPEEALKLKIYNKMIEKYNTIIETINGNQQ